VALAVAVAVEEKVNRSGGWSSRNGAAAVQWQRMEMCVACTQKLLLKAVRVVAGRTGRSCSNRRK